MQRYFFVDLKTHKTNSYEKYSWNTLFYEIRCIRIKSETKN